MVKVQDMMIQRFPPFLKFVVQILITTLALFAYMESQKPPMCCSVGSSYFWGGTDLPKCKAMSRDQWGLIGGVKTDETGVGASQVPEKI